MFNLFKPGIPYYIDTMTDDTQSLKQRYYKLKDEHIRLENKFNMLVKHLNVEFKDGEVI